MTDIDFSLNEQEFQQLTSRLIASDPLFSKIVAQANKQMAAARVAGDEARDDPKYRGNSHERISPQSR